MRLFYMLLPGDRAVLLGGMTKKRDDIPNAMMIGTCSATAGCETRSASAAAVNDPNSAAAQKQRICCKDKSSAFASAK